MTFLSAVEESFQITGRGCVIVPAKPRLVLGFRIRAGYPIQLRDPDGRVFDTHIASIEMICGPAVKKGAMAFLLTGHFTKPDVPKGTEVWLMND